MTLTPLPNIILQLMIERALAEDFGNSGDVTARLLVPENATATLVGQSLGAANPQRAERSVWVSGLFCSPFLAVATLISLIIASYFSRAERYT